eukprot:2005132-Alexandrium_andersonii.AAC.1
MPPPRRARRAAQFEPSGALRRSLLPCAQSLRTAAQNGPLESSGDRHHHDSEHHGMMAATADYLIMAV